MTSSFQAGGAFLFVVAGASAILLGAEPATLSIAGMVAGEGADIGLWFRLVVPGLLILLAIAGFWLFRQRPRGGGGALVAAALPTGIIAVAGMLAILWAGGFLIVNESPATSIVRLTAGCTLILIAVIAEELLLRGLLQPIVQRAFGMLVAVPLTALAFMLVHVVGGWRDPVSLLNIFMGGIWFGLLAARTGGLLAPVLAHFGYNMAEEILFGASPNPGIGMFGAWIDADLTGPERWGGSQDGLNASLVLSIMLAALILPLIYMRGMNKKAAIAA